MTRKYCSKVLGPRTIEIYKWALTQEDSFKAREIPSWEESALNKDARKALIDRGLIVVVNPNWPRSYKVGRVADLETCLDITETIDRAAKVTRYRVAPSIAESMGASPNLKQYAI